MTDIDTDEAPDLEPLTDLQLRRLLVALDGSPSADLALAAAVTTAHRDHAALTLLVVVPDVASESTLWLSGATNPRMLQADADAQAQRTLRQAVARVPSDIPVTTRIRHGKAGPEIVAQAREEVYDAILLGARGLGRVAALVGSVSSYVLHHAPVAVFVAHVPRTAEDG